MNSYTLIYFTTDNRHGIAIPFKESQLEELLSKLNSLLITQTVTSIEVWNDDSSKPSPFPALERSGPDQPFRALA